MAVVMSPAAAIGGSALAAGSSIANANNSYGTSSSYGYNMSDAINSAYQKVYGSAASAEDIKRAQEANILNQAFLEAQQTYNSAEAQKQREWQEYMSNTQYQRAVKDMIAAGINPIMAAFNGGAGTPNGGYASSGLQSAAKAQTFPDQESQSSGRSTSRGENWSSSMFESITQLMSFMDTLGDTAGKIADGLVSSAEAARQKAENFSKQYLQDNKGNGISNQRTTIAGQTITPKTYKKIKGQATTKGPRAGVNSVLW